MRRCPHAQVWHAAPIGRVVARLKSWLTKIRNLVLLESRSLEFADGRFEQRKAQLLVGFGNFLLAQEPHQRRIALVGQAVGRNVLHAKRNGAVQRGGPCGERLRGQTKHQIDADIAKTSLLQRAHSVFGLHGGVSAAEKTQFVVVETLNAHAHAVEGQLRPSGGLLYRHIVGITFERDFGIGVKRKIGVYRVENRLKISHFQKRWRATTKIYSRYRFAAQIATACPQFAAQCRHIARALRQVGAAVKSAVDTARFAKRYVQIQACHFAEKRAFFTAAKRVSPHFRHGAYAETYRQAAPPRRDIWHRATANRALAWLDCN